MVGGGIDGNSIMPGMSFVYESMNGLEVWTVIRKDLLSEEEMRITYLAAGPKTTGLREFKGQRKVTYWRDACIWNKPSGL